jgi:hypothetical protein
VRENAWGHHACGTCAIGPSDSGGVVDRRFQVHGSNGLRVVDASVFSAYPGYFLVTAVYMIAERPRTRSCRGDAMIQVPGDTSMAQPSPGNSQPGLYNWLGGYEKWLVRYWRQFDAFVNQPLPRGRALYWTWLAPDGYAWFVPALSILLIANMALGPTFRFAPANIALLILGLVLLLGLHIGAQRKAWIQQYLFVGQVAILFVLAILLLILAPPETFGDRSGSLRLHIGVAISIVLVLALGVAWWVAGRLFRHVGNGGFAQALSEVELFAPNKPLRLHGHQPFGCAGVGLANRADPLPGRASAAGIASRALCA